MHVSRLKSISTPEPRTELVLDYKITPSYLATLLSIILMRLNGNKTFIKIYHKNTDFNTISRIVKNLTEQINILIVDPQNIELPYIAYRNKILSEVHENQIYLMKDFWYRYNLDVCSEFAIIDNYFESIDDHRVVFAIYDDKVLVRYYKADTDFITILVKTMDVVLSRHNEISSSNLQIKNIPLLSDADYQKVIYTWNETDKAYPENKTIHQLFEEQVEKTPDNIALVIPRLSGWRSKDAGLGKNEADSVKFTYKELNERSNQLAHYLRKTYKIKGDDLVVLCLDRSEHMLIAILGVLKSGAAYVPIDPSYPDERIKYILEDTRAKVLLVNEVYKEKLEVAIASKAWQSQDSYSVVPVEAEINKEIACTICPIDNKVFQAKLSKESNKNPKPNITSQNLAYVIYTSGTTGKPKGTMVEHGQVNLFIQNFKKNLVAQKIQKKQSINMLSTTSYVFDIFCLEYMLPWLSGDSIKLSESDSASLFKNIQLSNYDYIQLTPSKIELLLSQSSLGKTKKGLHNITLLIGGEALNQNHLKLIRNYEKRHNNINFKIVNLYGPTESTIWSTMYVIQNDSIISIGKPLPNEVVYILDKQLNPLPPGAIGELYIGGAGLARGYLNQPELTHQCFISNPFQTEAEKRQNKNAKLYKTGDLVRYLPDGNLEYIGRNDFQIKINGFRIEIGEIESALNGYYGIKQSVVVVKEHLDKDKKATGNKYLVAYYTFDQVLNEHTALNYLKHELPEYMIPNTFVRLEKIPLTQNGKIDRKSLQSLEITTTVYVAPQTDAETKICQLYAEVLNLPQEQIGINHDFFALGGNSILAISLLYKLQQDFKIELNDIFKLKTPREIAKHTIFTKQSLYQKLRDMKLFYEKMAEIAKEVDSTEEHTQEMFGKKAHYLCDINRIEFTNKKKDIKNVLLTGATGHLGCHILYQLLFTTECNVYLLVRAASNKEAYSRIDNKFKYYFDISLNDYQDRISVLVADIERPNLNLRHNEYKDLATTIDSVIHSAALVKHYGNHETFYAANVGATINLLEFTKLTKLKDFHYISTLSVLNGYVPNYHYYVFTEDDNYLNLENNNNIYVQTKYEGERAVIKYRQSGVNTNIYRVGNLAMDSKNHRHQENIEENAFYTRVKTILDTSMIPREIAKVEISPVDYTATAIAKLFEQEYSTNQIYHVANSHLCDLSELLTSYKAAQIKVVTFDKFIEAMLTYFNNTINRPKIERFMLHQGWHEEIRLEQLTYFEVLQSRTDEILNKLDFEWPRITIDMIADIINEHRLENKKHTLGAKKMKKQEPIFEYLESIAELIPTPVSWTDKYGRGAGLNTVTMKAIGVINKKDIVGKTVFETYKNKAVGDNIQKINEEVMRTGKVSQTEDQVIDISTGKPKYFLATRAPLRNKKNEIIGVLGTAIDITAQKEKEKLRAQKEKEKIKAKALALELKNKKLENEANQKIIAEQERFATEKAKAKALELELKNKKLENEAQQKIIAEQERFATAIGKLAHDVKGQLEIFDGVMGAVSGQLVEDKRIALRKVSENVRDLTASLYYEYVRNPDEKKIGKDKNIALFVHDGLTQVVSLRRHAQKGKPQKITFEEICEENAYFVFIKMNPLDFTRMMENIIKNAVEALQNTENGLIQVKLAATPTEVIISVKDNGPGMPQHIQDKFKIGTSVTEGKKGGSGIGLTQVFETITSYDGKYEIKVDNGTNIILTFPRVSAPSFFATQIKVNPDDTIIILDDDEPIHDKWNERFEPLMKEYPGMKIKEFTVGQEALEYIESLSKNQRDSLVLLSDYELIEQAMYGPEVIEKSKIKRVTMVTSRAMESEVQEMAVKMGIKLLPKDSAAMIPIVCDKKIAKGSKEVDMVWVEDNQQFIDRLVNVYYRNLKIDSYNDPYSFLENVEQYPLKTRIILDTFYDDPVTKKSYDIGGPQLAKKLYDMGFTNMVICSGEMGAKTRKASDAMTIVAKDDETAISKLDKAQDVLLNPEESRDDNKRV